MQLTITKVLRNNRTSARTNRAYESVSIQAQEYGDKYINGFGRQDNKGWKEGDKIDVEVKEVQKDGKTFLNFEMPERPKVQGFTMEDRDRLLRVEIHVQSILNGIKSLVIEASEIKPPVESPFDEPPADAFDQE